MLDFVFQVDGCVDFRTSLKGRRFFKPYKKEGCWMMLTERAALEALD
jgi:hypothetical protein